MKNFVKINIFSLALVWASLAILPTAFASGQSPRSCAEAFGPSDPQLRREDAARPPLQPIPTEVWVNVLQGEGRLVYKGDHVWKPKSEFLASNEGDWVNTPFDHRPADILVAYGTNSAWEIAVDKSVKNLVLADWSPLPLLGHAYLIEPLMRISASAREFVGLLGAEIPDEMKGSLESALQKLGNERAFLIPPHQVEKFLRYIASRPEVTETDLRFMSTYFWSRTSVNQFVLNPFLNTRGPLFSHYPYFLNLRYSEVRGDRLNASALHNPRLFAKIRNLYASGHVRYAMAEATDPQFYQTLGNLHPDFRTWALSVTNIFGMSYNGHSFESFRKGLSVILASLQRHIPVDVTVFRTTRSAPPHGFYRYGLKRQEDIPKSEEPAEQAFDPWAEFFRKPGA